MYAYNALNNTIYRKILTLVFHHAIQPFSHSVWRPLPQFNSHLFGLCNAQSIYENSFSILSIAPSTCQSHSSIDLWPRLKNNMQWTPNWNPSVSESRLKSFQSSFFFWIFQSAANHSVLLFIKKIINEWWRTKFVRIMGVYAPPPDIQKLNCLHLNRQFYFHNI